jgi:hypothetical protein
MTEVAENEAVKKLLSALPLLRNMKAKLVEVEEKFSKINYYKRFAFNIDAPSIIPVEEFESFTLFMETSKKEILKIDKLFNKNELSEDLREIYLTIFLIMAKEGLPKEDKSVALGKVSGLWLKKVSYIMEMWNKLKYHAKVGYSQQAYDHISSYFQLIVLIKELEEKLLFLKTVI